MVRVLKSVFVCAALLMISWGGMVVFGVVGSGYMGALIGQRLDQPFDLSVFGAMEEYIRGSDFSYVDVPGNHGAYNQILTRKSDGEFYFDFGTTVRESMWCAINLGEQHVGREVPLPFVLLLSVHLCVVVCVRMCVCGLKRKSIEYRSRGLLDHGLRSLVYGIGIGVWYQFARMVWANDRWGVGAYLNDARIGNVGLYSLVVISLALYGWCVVGSGGYRVRRAEGVDERVCVGCGYSVEGMDSCAECGVEVGAFVDSRLRVRWIWFGGGMVIVFFAPVLVSSVYGVL